MIVRDLNLINKDIEERERSRKLRKWLPFLLLLSFVWLGLFENYAGAMVEVVDYFKYSMMDMGFGSTIFFSMLAYILIDWIWFEIILYFYKMLVGLSVFSYTIPKALLENNARIFMIYRNLILGIFMNLLFFFPYLMNLVIVVEIIVDVLVFAFFFLRVSRETVSIMILPNVLKMYFNSFAFIEFVHILIYVVGVL